MLLVVHGSRPFDYRRSTKGVERSWEIMLESFFLNGDNRSTVNSD
jgi:hypothetical protein